MTRRPITKAFDDDDIFASIETDDDDTDDNTQRMPDKLARAIALVPKLDRFMGHFLRGLRFERKDEFGSVMATNCVDTIYYDPAALDDPFSPIDWTPPLLACVVVHECMHILRLDGEFFFKAKDKARANVALDAVINKHLVDERYRFPGVEWATPEGWANGEAGPIKQRRTDHRTAPEIYNDLLKEKEEQDKQAQASGGSGDGEPLPDHAGKAVSDILSEEYEAARKTAGGAGGVKRKVQRMASAAQSSASAEEAAEAAEARGAQGEPEAPEAGGMGGEGSPGRGYGTDSPAITALLDDLGIIAKPPKNLLSNLAGSAIRGILTSRKTRVRTMLRPSPMTDVYRYVVPGRKPRHDVLPAVALDMSGSIDHETLCRFVGEAQLWTRQYVGRTTSIPCAFFNTHITKSGSLGDFRLGDNVPAPGGGTSFIPVYEWIKTLPTRPSHVLIWTDLMGAFPESPTGLESIWIAPPNMRGMESYVPFGKVIFSE